MTNLAGTIERIRSGNFDGQPEITPLEFIMEYAREITDQNNIPSAHIQEMVEMAVNMIDAEDIGYRREVGEVVLDLHQRGGILERQWAEIFLEKLLASMTEILEKHSPAGYFYDVVGLCRDAFGDEQAAMIFYRFEEKMFEEVEEYDMDVSWLDEVET